MNEQEQSGQGATETTQVNPLLAIKEQYKDNVEVQTALLADLMQTQVGAKYLNNTTAFATAELEKKLKEQVSDATKSAYSNIDEMYKQLGYERPAGVKTTDFIASIHKELQTKKGKEQEDTKADDNKIFEKYKTEVQAKEKEYQTQLQTLQQELANTKLVASINQSSFEFNDTLPAALVKQVQASTINNLMQNKKTNEDGTVYFIDDKGEAYSKPSENRYLTAQEVLEIKYKELEILKQQPTAGTGAGTAKTTTSIDSTGTVVFDTTGVKTKVQFLQQYSEAAAKQGILAGTKEFADNYSKLKDTDSYRGLPDA